MNSPHVLALVLVSIHAHREPVSNNGTTEVEIELPLFIWRLIVGKWIACVERRILESNLGFSMIRTNASTLNRFRTGSLAAVPTVFRRVGVVGDTHELRFLLCRITSRETLDQLIERLDSFSGFIGFPDRVLFRRETLPETFSEFIDQQFDAGHGSIVLVALYGSTTEVHQLVIKILGGLPPFLDDRGDDLLLFRRERSSRPIENLLRLVAKLVERVFGCGLRLLCDERRHKEQQHGESAFQVPSC
jgi:hypothetical protein